MLFKQSFLAVAAAAAVGPALAHTSQVQVSNGLNLYWGQYGQPDDRLSGYCDAPGVTSVSVSFVTYSPKNSGGWPGTNFAGHCGSEAFYTDPKTGNQTQVIMNCDYIKQDIKYCQSKGVKVLLAIGGQCDPKGPCSYDIDNEQQGHDFAEMLHNMYGPFDKSWTGPRPFDISETEHVAIDGFDFDIEFKYPDQRPWIRMVEKLRSCGAYYIAAAPQCPTSDQWFQLKELIYHAQFDSLFVHFYNNPGCQLSDTPNYDDWETVLSKTSKSKDAKLYIGVLASSASGWNGYAPPQTIKDLVCKVQNRPSFGGVSIWDATRGAMNMINGQSFNGAVADALKYGCDDIPVSTVSVSASASASVSAVASASGSVSAASASASASASDSVSASATGSTSATGSASGSANASDSVSQLGNSATVSVSASATASGSMSDFGASASASASATVSVTASSSGSHFGANATVSASGSATAAASGFANVTNAVTSASGSASASATKSATSTDDTCDEDDDGFPSTTMNNSQSAAASGSGAGSASAASAASVTNTVTSGSGTAGASATKSASPTDDTCDDDNDDGVSSTKTASVSRSAASSTGDGNGSSNDNDSASSTGAGTAKPTATATGSVSDKASPTGGSGSDNGFVTQSAKNSATISIADGMTTSTVFTTTVHTVASCPPSVPCTKGQVVTRTIPWYTTVCPISAASSAAPKPPTTSVPQWVTSTVYSTRTYTISSCPPNVRYCPVGEVTTAVVPAYTTVCLYTGPAPGGDKPTNGPKPPATAENKPSGDAPTPPKTTGGGGQGGNNSPGTVPAPPKVTTPAGSNGKCSGPNCPGTDDDDEGPTVIYTTLTVPVSPKANTTLPGTGSNSKPTSITTATPSIPVQASAAKIGAVGFAGAVAVVAASLL